MATAFRLSASPKFPEGTVVGAYLRRTWAGPPPAAGQSPGGVAAASAQVVKGVAAFSGLEEGVDYFAGAQVAGTWLWITFTTDQVVTTAAETARAEAAELRLERQIKELGGAGGGSGTGQPPEEKPAPPPTEEANPPANGPGGNATAGALLFGINSNSSKGHGALWTSWKVFGDRSDGLDIDYVASPAEASAAVGASLAAGCKPLPILNSPDNEVLGKLVPATVAAGCLAIVERVLRDHPTVTTFQFINEPYYKGSSPHGSKVGSNATVYGELLKAFMEALKTAGIFSRVTILVEAFGEYNTYSGKASEEAQTPSGIFRHWVRDICETLKDPVGMVIGDSYTLRSFQTKTAVGRQEAFQFTAGKTGPVKELRFRTNGIANTGVTSVVMGVLADEAGKPGAVLAQATFAATPATEAWVRAELLQAIALTGGTKYWLAILPLGTAGAFLHYNVKGAAGTGTGDEESVATNLTELVSAPAGGYTSFNQGPLGFQAGTELQHSLAEQIGGWSSHPYGTLGEAGSLGNFNWGCTEGFRRVVAEMGAGGNNNWWLTEWGWQSSGTQGERMLGFLEKSAAAHAEGWLTAIFAYDDGDDGWSLYKTVAGGQYREYASAHG